MTNSTIQVQGMTCGHCVSTVTTAVGAVAGVSAVQVDLRSGTVTTTGTADAEAVAQAITAAGYDVTRAYQAPAAGRNLPLADTGCCCG